MKKQTREVLSHENIAWILYWMRKKQITMKSLKTQGQLLLKKCRNPVFIFSDLFSFSHCSC